MDFEKSSSVYHCFLHHHVCLPNLKHAPSRKLPLVARKTVFSHLKTKSFILLSCWRQETRVYIDSFPFAYRITTVELPSSSHLTCSQTLYFLFKFRQARVIKYKLQGSYWLPAQGGRGGGRRNVFSSRSMLVLVHLLRSPMFSKRTKRKIK